MNGDTALHYAIKNNALNVIDKLCVEKIDFTLSNNEGFNMLHYAAFVGNVHATKRLVTQVPHLVDMKMEDGNAALHLAALKGHREVAAILLSQNGGRAEVDLRNNLGQTPLSEEFIVIYIVFKLCFKTTAQVSKILVFEITKCFLRE
ncbi:PREDICTED: E3 ubiquitin-protein ligase MIB2-like [Wasmannia auropunctata]|uniref:E3 ubiquitin-protein ligase MIB2-like n=1 Tax=Wasmannia auropunctata TaxID=64793 RepID=UPI0005EF5186|nr:PREDICTED: E3 ubiquitin-protein ligase MIB2-like [Wasmannia auropunctata]